MLVLKRLCKNIKTFYQRPYLTNVKSIRHPLNSKDVEDWERIPYVLTGYRQCDSYVDCLKSMVTTLHNDSFNAWSMISFMTVCIFLTLDIIAKNNMTYPDVVPFYVLMISQIIHCPISAGFHSFRVISKETLRKWRNADISVLLLVNVFCTYSAAHFTLRLENTIKAIAISSIFALYGIYDIFSKDTSKRDLCNKSAIVTRFILSGLPLYLIIMMRSVIEQEFLYAGMLAVFNLLGGLCYCKHWPQRYYPRRFDIFGGSHNLMHIFCCSSNIIGLFYLEQLYYRQNTWVLI